MFTLFLSMLKIGCFAFGGGYAIIALLENEGNKEPVILNNNDIEGNANNNDIDKDLFNDAIVSEENPDFQEFLQETNNNNNAKVK